MKYTVKCQISLGNKVTVKNLAQRHNLKITYNKPNSEIIFSGEQKSFKSLKSDRGWQQFKKFNHINHIHVEHN